MPFLVKPHASPALLLLSIYVSGLNLMNYFASVRYSNSSCGTAGSVWQGSEPWNETCCRLRRHNFIPEEQSRGSASLEPIVTQWHIFMSTIPTKGCSSVRLGHCSMCWLDGMAGCVISRHNFTGILILEYLWLVFYLWLQVI